MHGERVTEEDGEVEAGAQLRRVVRRHDGAAAREEPREPQLVVVDVLAERRVAGTTIGV